MVTGNLGRSMEGCSATSDQLRATSRRQRMLKLQAERVRGEQRERVDERRRSLKRTWRLMAVSARVCWRSAGADFSTDGDWQPGTQHGGLQRDF
mmetsp:Transcript_50228/g.156991  ORF Transcript_50228/g.156991 Transcript_50228/m.156991 type:complete len:94 (-) Transcript_50228:64-345(-)